MDKLFVRSEDWEKALREKTYTYSNKNDQKKFEDYVYTFIGEEYRRTAEPYFKKADKEGYLETLIKLSDQLEPRNERRQNSQNLTAEERSRLLQALAVAIYKPKLLFKYWGSEHKAPPDAVHAFEKKIQKIYQKWDAYQEELTLCQYYIERGTTQINRPSTKDRLIQGRQQMVSEINSVYSAYYHYLKSIGLSPKEKAVALEGDHLILNAYERPWLLPLAHVILIRDAQYQMMGRQKYDKATLLWEGIPFDAGQSTAEQSRQLNIQTYVCALRIRDIIARYLHGKLKSDCMAAYEQHFSEVFSTETDESLQSWWYLLECCRNRSRIKEKAAVFDAPDFSVPVCQIKTTALWITKHLQLMPSQATKIENVLWDALWGNNSLESALSGFSTDLVEKLTQILDPLRRLVNPKEYFSEGESEAVISDRLRSPAATIYSMQSGQEVPRSKQEKTSLGWNTYHNIIRFQDLTHSALLLSNAVDLQALPDDLLLGFDKYCRSGLHHGLKKYRKISYISGKLGIGDIKYKKLKRDIQLDWRCIETRRHLMYAVAKVNSEEELSLDSAIKFLRKLHDIKKPNTTDGQSTRHWENELQKLEGDKKELKPVLSAIEREKRMCLCLDVYHRLACRSILLLEEHIAGILVKTARQVYMDSAPSFS